MVKVTKTIGRNEHRSKKPPLIGDYRSLYMSVCITFITAKR